MSFPRRSLLLWAGATALTLALMEAHATLPPWLQHVVGASAIESALYRVLPLPAVRVLYPRPPKEAQAELARLIALTPAQAELYAVRARSGEDALDFAAAEADWKLYAAHANDKPAATLELANFYHRRLLVPQEMQTLSEVAAAPPDASERFTAPAQQRSWQTYERLLALATDQALPATQTHAIYAAFLTRYADQPAVYAAYLQLLLNERDFNSAAALVTRYHKALPADEVFPIRAQALLEYRRGNVDQALAVYDQAFQPLWPPDLIQSWFALLAETHRQRAFAADARARLAQHPDGPAALNALARLFYYDQQAGRLDQAQQTLNAFRSARDQRIANQSLPNGAWTPLDLATLAALSDMAHAYAESARYNYALASTPGTLPSGEPAGQAGLSGLIRVLLTAPDQPIALGAGNLTLYRDIATLDQGPGYWNGILSLWLNGTSPEDEYNAATAPAQSYFHRAKAAELLAQLDARYPAAPECPALHAGLLRAYAQYNESDSVIAEGKQFLAAFPSAPDRVDVAGLVADAYARQRNTTAEFALYDALLAELGARLKVQAGGLPLTAAGLTPAIRQAAPDEPGDTPALVAASGSATKPLSLNLGSYKPAAPVVPAAIEYSRILDRYLGRLTAEKHLPQALMVLRRQLDLNPNDPLLYERLASFMQQNNLSASQEEIFQLAIAHFQQPTWYDKLARLYLRERKREAYAALNRQVVDIFSGTDLDRFFAGLGSTAQRDFGGQLALQLNLYAQQRFPHDLVFTRNLLALYSTPATRNPAAFEDLLRRHWWDSEDLRNQFFTYLGRTGKLDAELAALQPLNIAPSGASDANPAAARELAEVNLWSSHFEQAAPLMNSVASLYPADPDLGDRAVSLFRSLAYLDPTPLSLDRAVALEKNLSAADPGDLDRLATLGDLYAEASSTGGEDLRAAAPYWRRMPAVHPGISDGFLTAATIFWDYFQFDDALAQLHAARDRFHQPALFGFEAGAIDENRHDLPAAVAEYTAAALALPASAARGRLLQLATRPATRALVDQASAAAFQRNAGTSALPLRADVLVAQHREPELPPLFVAALNRASTFDDVAAIGALAQTRMLPLVYEQSLTRQIALASDPVQKIELSYTLARSLEARKQIPDAEKIIDTVYRANPRILGVVRATTDFYARANQPPRSIAILLEAASLARPANPTLARSFTLQAAQRANEAGDTAQARSLALGLLPATPYDAQLLSIIATSYARARDDAALQHFSEAQLAAVRTAPLTPDERKQDTALLRRGLIPALTRLHDDQGALNQYIALLSAFPEDSATAQQAALYALRTGRQSQLLGFLQTTVKQSPNDSRFAILLAQVETTFEDLPGALAAYNQAIALRKDRADLYTARVDLELRLGLADPSQLELAAADFSRLYLLTYKDPAWMVRLAELRARQQRPADVVKALQAAYVEARPPAAANCFNVAAQLERWNLLPQARSFAEQGVALAGGALLTPKNASPEEPSGAVLYARILTRLGKPDEALKRLVQTRAAANNSGSALADLDAEIASANSPAANAADLRKSLLEQRHQLADRQLALAIDSIGKTAAVFFTPEQKLAFALVLDGLHQTDPQLALTAATAAGLADREAAYRRQLLLSGPTNQPANEQSYIALEQRRLAFPELAQTLEAYAARIPPVRRSSILQQAAQAYRDAGDDTSELRLERPLVLASNSALRDRFFDLLLRHDPAALRALAASDNASLADAAVNYTLTHGDQTATLAAVAQRGRKLPPVWQPASATLVLTWFASPASTPAATASFQDVLAFDAPIATRLAKPADPARQLTGDLWFYYAARFGMYLDRLLPTAAAASEDFLPAELERTPTSPSAYLQLARTYAERDHLPAALAEYNHALELAPDDPATHDEQALLLFRFKRQPDALTQWRAALALLLQMQQNGLYAESFFTDLKTILRHLGERSLLTPLRPEVEPILRGYFAKNAGYRSNELLQAVYAASPNPVDGANLILTLIAAAPEPAELLDDLRRVPWLPPNAREIILLRQIELARSRPPSSDGTSSALTGYQRDLVQLYLDQNQFAKAQATLDSISAEPAVTLRDRTILATRTHHLEALLDSWRANPDLLPTDADLNSALYYLRRPTTAYTPSSADIRPLQEFVFARKQLAHTLQPTDFLALAQSRLDTNDLAGALVTLHRLTLQPASTYETGQLAFPGPDAEPGSLAADSSMVGQPPTIAYGGPDPSSNRNANIDYAATLLEATHHPAEALPYLAMLTQSAPWDSAYRLRLAHAQRDAGQSELARNLLSQLLRDPTAPYPARVTAAHDLHALAAAAPAPGNAELALLTAPSLSPAAARQPFFAEARIAAASTPILSTDRAALLREAIAISPSGPSADRARLSLLLLADPSTSPSATLALLGYVQQSPSEPQPTDTPEATAPEPAPEPSSEPVTPTVALPPLAAALDLPTRIHLADLLATACERNNQPTLALAYLQLALKLSATPAPALIRRRDDLLAQLALDRRNATRQPNFHPQLAQQNQVRPRLTRPDLLHLDLTPMNREPR